MTEARRHYMKKILTVLLWGALALLPACSKDDPEAPDSEGIFKPDEPVPDPAGTVSLSMWNNNETSLNGLEIGADNNFHGYGFNIVDLGAVRGLGNVSYIPLEGWADKVSVIPGHGYVAVYNNYSYNPVFYRIYVYDTIISTTGGVIGYEIKYQSPFKGADQALSFTEKAVTFPSDGGEMEVIFNNSSNIPFSVESSEDWCKVSRASTTLSFLHDAILISCEGSTSATPSKAKITLTTASGKISTIDVTREALGGFFSLSATEAFFDFNATDTQTMSIPLHTNMALSDFEVSSNVDWCTAEVSVVEKRNGKPKRHIKWIEGVEQTRSRAETIEPLYLNISVSPYTGRDSRNATVSLKNGSEVKTVDVRQSGAMFYLSEDQFTVNADKQWLTIPYNTILDTNNISLVLDESNSDEINGEYNWIRGSKETYTKDFKFSIDENKSPKARKATYQVIYQIPKTGETLEIGNFTITQMGMEYKDEYLYLDKTEQNYTINIPGIGGENITVTANWLTATASGNDNLIIRIQATTENRSAIINVGDWFKIFVSQSKYAAGDTYSENGVEGTIACMEDGVGVIYYYDYTTMINLVWSTECVDNFEARSSVDGMANCNAIKGVPNWKSYYPALAYVEDNLNVNGVTGWYIPASKELQDYLSKIPHPNLIITCAWSSTEDSADNQLVVYPYPTSILISQNKKTSPTFDRGGSRYAISTMAFHKFSYDFFTGKAAKKHRR